MTRWIWFALPFTIMLAAASFGLSFVIADPPPCDDVTEVGFDDLDPATPCVRLTGTAHYPSVVTQRVPDSLVRPGGTWYLFGLFPVHDTDDRAIRVLVRTRREPERLVSYETMTVEGRLRPPTKELVPPQTEQVLSEQRGYFFDDRVVVLEAERITSGDEVWEEADAGP